MRRNKQLRNDLKRVRGSLKLDDKQWMATVVDNAMKVISYQEEQIGFMESKIHVLSRQNEASSNVFQSLDVVMTRGEWEQRCEAAGVKLPYPFADVLSFPAPTPPPEGKG